MKRLISGAIVALVLAVAVPSTFAQGVLQLSPDVKQAIEGTSPRNPDFFNFFTLAPDNVGGLTFVLAISNLVGAQAIAVDVLAFPFSNAVPSTHAFAARETKFLLPPDVFCRDTVCQIFIRTVPSAFTFDSLLLLIDRATGEIVTIIGPFRFVA